MADTSNFERNCRLLAEYMKERRRQYLVEDGFNMKTAQATMNLLNTMEAIPASPDLPVDQPSSSPMIIYYGGRVLVFSDISIDNAKEIMGLATKESPVVSSAESKALHQQQQQPQAIGSDLPIARRHSLHKFLTKRKERVNAIAPYQLNHNQRAAFPNQEEQEQSSKQLELSL